MGAGPSGADPLPDAGADVAGLCGLLPAGPGRGPPLHLSRDGGAHLLAGRDGAAGGRAGDRQARAHAAGGALRRQDPQLLQAGRVADHLPDQGLVEARRCRQRLVHRAQEDRRYPRHAAGGHPGALLQRRIRRCLRRDLRARERRLQLCRTEDLRRRRAPAAAACEGRGQGRAVRRAGREDLRRGLAEAPGAAGAGLQRRAVAARTAERRRERRHDPGAPGRAAGAGGRPVHQRGATALYADPRQFRQPDPAGRHRGDPARLRRSAAGQGAAPGQGGDRAGHLHGQGRRHHRAGQVAARGHRRHRTSACPRA